MERAKRRNLILRQIKLYPLRTHKFADDRIKISFGCAKGLPYPKGYVSFG